MQLTGDRFTSVSAAYGNDLSTLPEYPAEIRAPAGTVHGVSSFQVHISDHPITTPGDEPNVLVAMNPAALRADLGRLEQGGTLIVNEDAFDERNLEKAGYSTPDGATINPLDDGSLDGYRLIRVPMTSLTKEVAAPLGVKPRDAERSKNFFALGLVSWMYTRPTEPDAGVDREALRHQRAGRRGQPGGVPRRLQLRRDDRGRRSPLRGPPGDAAGRRVHQRHRQHRARLGHRRRRSAGQAAGHARVVPDHPGVGHPPRAVQAQALRRAHGAGRGRDRRRAAWPSAPRSPATSA